MLLRVVEMPGVAAQLRTIMSDAFLLQRALQKRTAHGEPPGAGLSGGARAALLLVFRTRSCVHTTAQEVAAVRSTSRRRLSATACKYVQLLL